MTLARTPLGYPGGFGIILRGGGYESFYESLDGGPSLRFNHSDLQHDCGGLFPAPHRGEPDQAPGGLNANSPASVLPFEM